VGRRIFRYIFMERFLVTD